MMAALTPALAVRYLAELEPALDRVAIRDADGATLAGDPSLPATGAALLSARAARHVVVAHVPPGALLELVRHDLEAVARDLG